MSICRFETFTTISTWKICNFLVISRFILSLKVARRFLFGFQNGDEIRASRANWRRQNEVSTSTATAETKFYIFKRKIIQSLLILAKNKLKVNIVTKMAEKMRNFEGKCPRFDEKSARFCVAPKSFVFKNLFWFCSASKKPKHCGKFQSFEGLIYYICQLFRLFLTLQSDFWSNLRNSIR